MDSGWIIGSDAKKKHFFFNLQICLKKMIKYRYQCEILDLLIIK